MFMKQNVRCYDNLIHDDLCCDLILQMFQYRRRFLPDTLHLTHVGHFEINSPLSWIIHLNGPNKFS